MNKKEDIKEWYPYVEWLVQKEFQKIKEKAWWDNYIKSIHIKN